MPTAEQIRAYKYKWFVEHKEEIYKRRKEYLKSDPEAILRRREKDREYHKKYRKVNQVYKARERERGKQRMIELKQSVGAKCALCGYNKNYAALEFHHIRDKEFNLSTNALKSYKMTKILEEVSKCQLWCANCHREHHNPHLKII